MTMEPPPQFRKVAILVASLDQQSAERLLAELPPADAAAIARAAEQLGEIDLEEQRQVVGEFRSRLKVPESSSPRQQASSDSEGVELDPSLLARIESQAQHEEQPAVPEVASLLDEDDIGIIAEALSHEHLQTIALMLSRLEQSLASRLLERLPITLQAEALERMATLDMADEDSLQVVEAQLSDWIKQHQMRKQRQTLGMKTVERLLESSSPDQREVLVAKLRAMNSPIADRLGSTAAAAPPIRQPPAPASDKFPAPSRPRKGDSPDPSSSGKAPIAPAKDREPPMQGDPLLELERVDAALLDKALCESDQQQVILALTGASEALLKRILSRLPRRKRRLIRKQLLIQVPTQLREIEAAQHRLLHRVRQLQNTTVR